MLDFDPGVILCFSQRDALLAKLRKLNILEQALKQ